MSFILEHLEQTRRLGLSQKQEKYFDFLIENGVSFKNKIDFVHTCEKIEIQVKECFRNSILSAFAYGFDYYEGYYLTEVLPIPLEHGFNRAFNHDVVIDMTANKFNIPVVEWFGVKVPEWVLDEFVESEFNGICSPLQYYYRFHIDK